MLDTTDLPAVSSSSDFLVRLDSICDRFERAWQTGVRPRLEDFLAEVADEHRAWLLRDLLPLEVEYRRRSGETPTVAEYRGLFPELTEFLTSLLAEHTPPPPGWAAAMTGLLGPPVSAGDLGTFAGYRVLRVLGEGGMGLVLEAVDSRLDRRLALKVIRPALLSEPRVIRRFLREARCAAAITHDNILPVYQVGEDRGIPFIAMPLLPGQTLDARLRQHPVAPLSLVLQVGREAAQGLAAAHERGLIHRDIKPANIWLEEVGADSSDSRLRIKLLDFGLARSINVADSISTSNHVLGTPSYMSPEQAQARPIDGRSDLFSLGCVLYQMAAGKSPFPADSLTALLLAITTQDPVPPAALRPDLPAALSDFILRLLAKNPDQRPASARQAIEELAAIETTLRLEATAPYATNTTSGAAPVRKRRWWLAASVAAVIAVTALVAVVVTERWPAPSKGQGSQSGEHHGSSSPSKPVAGKPLKIVAVDVFHYPYRGGQRAGRLELGQPGEEGSFAMHQGDGAELRVRLSRAGYAFVLAFRPDGKVERVLPRKADEPPPQVEEFTYPLTTRSEVDYRMEEGTGLHAFAVVASSKPLPAFEQWWSTRQESGPWGRYPAPPAELVWYDDGVELETRTPRGPEERGARAADRKVPGKSQIIELTDWLRRQSGVESVTVVGFGVRPEEK